MFIKHKLSFNYIILARAFLKLSGINPRIGGASSIEKDSNSGKELKKLQKCLLSLKNDNDIKAAVAAVSSTTTINNISTDIKQFNDEDVEKNEFKIDSKFAEKILHELKQVNIFLF